MNIIYAEVFSGIFCPNYEAVYSKKQLGSSLGKSLV